MFLLYERVVYHIKSPKLDGIRFAWALAKAGAWLIQRESPTWFKPENFKAKAFHIHVHTKSVYACAKFLNFKWYKQTHINAHTRTCSFSEGKLHWNYMKGHPVYKPYLPKILKWEKSFRGGRRLARKWKIPSWCLSLILVHISANHLERAKPAVEIYSEGEKGAKARRGAAWPRLFQVLRAILLISPRIQKPKSFWGLEIYGYEKL